MTTNYEKIKNMSIEEMARYFLIFIPNNNDFHYAGLDGYHETAEEAISASIKFPQQEAE